ncbi:hypothetical protein V8C35DRAFT_101676 [Trichoderma chlorosporum]
MGDDGAVPGHGPWSNISIMPTVSTCNSSMPVTVARLLAYGYCTACRRLRNKSPCVRGSWRPKLRDGCRSIFAPWLQEDTLKVSDDYEAGCLHPMKIGTRFTCPMASLLGGGPCLQDGTVCDTRPQQRGEGVPAWGTSALLIYTSPRPSKMACLLDWWLWTCTVGFGLSSASRLPLPLAFFFLLFFWRNRVTPETLLCKVGDGFDSESQKSCSWIRKSCNSVTRLVFATAAEGGSATPDSSHWAVSFAACCWF